MRIYRFSNKKRLCDIYNDFAKSFFLRKLHNFISPIDSGFIYLIIDVRDTT